MQRFEILNEAGDVVRTVEESDTMRPALLAGESLRLTHIDGEPAISGEPVKLLESDVPLPAIRPDHEIEATETGVTEPLPDHPHDL